MKTTIKVSSKPGSNDVSFFVECRLHRHTLLLKVNSETDAYEVQNTLEDVESIEVKSQ